MKNKVGYSLIKIIVMFVFVGVSFPGLIAFFTNIMTNSGEGGAYSQAIVFMQLIEE